MHFVDEQDGMPPALLKREFGTLHRFAYVLDACQHRGNRNELRVECMSHQACAGATAPPVARPARAWRKDRSLRAGRRRQSVMTSAPLGGVNRKTSGDNFGLRSTLANLMTVVCAN